ncbi:hypothetical protein [Streptomyces sp. NPDC002845]
MSVTALRRGALLGMLGGMAMAAWSMILLGLTGLGFWAPLNLIAHTVWRSAPLNGTFSLPALLIGMAVHAMMAMLFGTLITLVAQQLRGVRVHGDRGGHSAVRAAVGRGAVRRLASRRPGGVVCSGKDHEASAAGGRDVSARGRRRG